MSKLLAALFEGVPSLVAAELSPQVEACLAAMTADPRAPEILAAHAAAGDGFWPEPGHWMAQYRPYIVEAGILQIPIKGVLLANLSVTYGSFATGYPYIARAIERGLGDRTVRGIALLCDSPGGEVRGCFDVSDRIFAGRGQKPIRAFAHDSAYSAAYALASAADRIVVSRTGGVGSIGVVVGHTDVSAALAASGVKKTFVFFGKHKVDGNSFEPLPEAVRARMQERIDELGAVFVSTVARNRGLDEAAVIDTQALTYGATSAVVAGLADEVGSLDDAVAAFALDVSTSPQDETMSDITQAAHEAALADARTSAASEAASAAAARLSTILADPRSKGKERAALALPASMSAEDVLAYLDANVAAPSAGTAAARLDALVPDPNVSADTPPAGAPTARAGLSAAVAAEIARK